MLQAFAIYAVGFIARPIGAAIFGHYGDRIGRKAALIATLLITGLATFAVGFVPTYESDRHLGRGHSDRHPLHPGDRRRRRMGRLGVAVDGMGAHQPASRLHRLLAAIRRAGRVVARQSGGACSSVGFPATSSWSGAGAYRFCSASSWSAVGLYIRLGILETPAFQRLVAEKRIERVPVLEVIRRQPKEIILSALARTGEQAPAYIYLAFVFTYGTQVLHARATSCSAPCWPPAVMSFLSIPLSGHLSDRIGRKRMYLIGAVATGIFGFIYFAMLNSLVPALDVPRHHAVLGAARHDVWPAGGVDRGVLHPAAALQRLPRSAIISPRSRRAGRRR